MGHPQHRLGILLILVLLLAAFTGRCAEVLPPPPKAYFNDYAHVVRPETARQLNAQLSQFERDTSNQLVVAVFPKMQTDSSIEDYTVRIAQSWHVGQKGRDNGAILFVFVQDHKIYIQVGYGLEGSLTDYLCHRIINENLKPHFRSGDFDGGLRAGVAAMIAATKGEYKGGGKTVAESQSQNTFNPVLIIFLALMIWVVFSLFFPPSNRRRDRFSGGGGGPIIFGGGGGSGFGGSGGGFGGFSGGGGGFSGGGGSFGGGGAGGSW